MTDPWDLLTVSVEPTNGHTPAPPPTDQAHTEMPWADESVQYVFDFGKWKGKRIQDVPTGYVNWCLENTDRLDPGHPRFNLSLWEIFRRRLGLPVDDTFIELLKKARQATAKIEKAKADLESKKSAASLSDGLRRAIRGWYSTMARRYHPDHGGSEVQQVVVNACYQELVKTLDAWEKKT